jgi:hypothetical protein
MHYQAAYIQSIELAILFLVKLHNKINVFVKIEICLMFIVVSGLVKADRYILTFSFFT